MPTRLGFGVGGYMKTFEIGRDCKALKQLTPNSQHQTPNYSTSFSFRTKSLPRRPSATITPSGLMSTLYGMPSMPYSGTTALFPAHTSRPQAGKAGTAGPGLGSEAGVHECLPTVYKEGKKKKKEKGREGKRREEEREGGKRKKGFSVRFFSSSAKPKLEKDKFNPLFPVSKI